MKEYWVVRQGNVRGEGAYWSAVANGWQEQRRFAHRWARQTQVLGVEGEYRVVKVTVAGERTRP